MRSVSSLLFLLPCQGKRVCEDFSDKRAFPQKSAQRASEPWYWRRALIFYIKKRKLLVEQTLRKQSSLTLGLSWLSGIAGHWKDFHPLTPPKPISLFPLPSLGSFLTWDPNMIYRMNILFGFLLQLQNASQIPSLSWYQVHSTIFKFFADQTNNGGSMQQGQDSTAITSRWGNG